MRCYQTSPHRQPSNNGKDGYDLCEDSLTPFKWAFGSNITLFWYHRLAKCNQIRHLASKNSPQKAIPLIHQRVSRPWTYPFSETTLESLIEQMRLPTATRARLAWYPLIATTSHFQTYPPTSCWHEKGSCKGRIGKYELWDM
jgi:hypothetical protein